MELMVLRVASSLWAVAALMWVSIGQCQPRQPNDGETTAQHLMERTSKIRSWLTASSTLAIGARRSESSRVEIPWRPLESTQLAPQRLEAGMSYHFGADLQGRFDLGLMLFPQPSYLEGPMAPHYESVIESGEVTLGEVSATLPLSRSHHLTLGRMLYRIDGGVEGGQLYHTGDEHHQPLWTWEERYWSWSASPLERWVSGLSLSGAFGDEVISKPDTINPYELTTYDPLSIAYRVSVFMPQEQIEVIQYRGVVATGQLGVGTPSWQFEIHSIWGHNLALNPATARWVDQQINVSQMLYQLPTLSSREITYRGIWLGGRGRIRLYRGLRYALWMRARIDLRYITLDQERGLRALEEAALAESNTIGDGRAWILGLYGDQDARHRSVQKNRLSVWPDHWGLTYLARDPHLDFGYDERHRVRMHLGYRYLHSWGRLALEFWYTHLWSAAENRWRQDSDIGGITLEVGLSAH